MPQISAALTINDGSATPVAKSFAPERVSPDQSVFTERSPAVSAGFPRLKIAFSAATKQRPTNRVDYEVSLPTLAVVNGVNTVAYTGLAKGYFVMPDTMTSAERANLHAFVANAMAHATVKAVIKDLDPLY